MATAQHLPRPTRSLRQFNFRAIFVPRNIVAVLTLCAFALYLWRIEALCLWWDESLSLYRAQQDIPFILSGHIDFPGVSTTDQHPPLYFIFLHFFMRLSGESDLTLRYLSVASTTFLIPLLYVFGVRLRGAHAGLWAAIFGALSPFYLWYAQEARMYTLVTALGLISLYALWRACAERRWGWWAAFALTTAAALATQYLYALVSVGEVLLGLLLWPRARSAKPVNRRALYIGAAITVGLAALFAALFWPRIVTLVATLKTGRRYVPLSTILWDVLNSFSVGLSVSLSDARVLDLGFFSIFMVGLISAWIRPLRLTAGQDMPVDSRSRAIAMMFFLGMILTPVLILWFFSLFVPIYMNSRYLMMASPVFYLGLGLGVETLASWKRLLGWLTALTLATCMSVSVYRYFYNERFSVKENYRAAAQAVMRNERVGDVVVVNGPESLTAFNHYYRGYAPVVGLPVAGADETQVAADLTRLTQSYDRVWLLQARTAVTDPQKRVQAWFDENTLFLSRIGYPSNGYYLRLSTYLARSPIESAEGDIHAIGAFDGKLDLARYELRYRDASGSVHEVAADVSARYWEQLQLAAQQGSAAADTSVSLVLHWRPLQTLKKYKMSLRLLSDGLIWVQHDREPFTYLPTTEWPVGDVLRHEMDLRIPEGTPPGIYRLQLVVYDAESGQGLAFRDAITGQEQGYIDLGPLMIAKRALNATGAEFVPEGATCLDHETIFGPSLQLLGYRLGPRTVKPGDNLTLGLYWQARRKMNEDYVLVMNWEDASGRVWYSSEQPLVGREYPSRDWDAGERVWGVQRVFVPVNAPMGAHKVHLLVRERDGQHFLWLRRGLMLWSGRNLPIAEITVE